VEETVTSDIRAAQPRVAMRITLSLILLLPISSARAAEMVVEDIHGRRLNEHGLILVDWEGQIANPAIKFFIVPPAGTTFPARVVLTSPEPRVYFNLPSETGPRGPRKVIDFKKQEKVPVLVSIFPDRGGKDRDLALQIEFRDALGREQSLKLPCHVIDQDKKGEKIFPIIVDFSRDRTGFFKDEKNRRVVEQAARDWAYFFEPVPLAPVPAGEEKTFIWDPDGFKNGKVTLNDKEYTGYLLYAYGIQSGELRSGGEPSRAGGFQSQKGKALSLRRSGGVEIETRGNFNTKGWLVSLSDDDSWKATNLAGVENDLYSIAHHEIGHSLIFNPANPLFDEAKRVGKLADPAVREYLGADPKLDKADHLAGGVDPASRRGAFGNEYHGDMPRCRWQITKLDLLCARAVGYPLRETSAFAPRRIESDALPGGVVGKAYAQTLRATGGIPFYNWEVAAGSLPTGLKLDSFSGAITGTPAQAGVFEFTIRVRDYEENVPGKCRKLRVEIGPG
jgi:hypothetical protein